METSEPEQLDLIYTPEQYKSEGEMARLAYGERFAGSFAAESRQYTKEGKPNKLSEFLGSEFALRIADYLDKEKIVDEDQRAAFFEAIPNYFGGVRVEGSFKRQLRVPGQNFEAIPEDHRLKILKECSRAVLLTKGAEEVNKRRGDVDFDLGAHLQVLSLEHFPQNGEQVVIKNQASSEEGVREGIDKCFKEDPELFGALVVTLSGSIKNDLRSIPERWSQPMSGENKLPIERLNGLGLKIKVTNDGYPYRVGHRAEDIKIVKETLQRYENQERVLGTTESYRQKFFEVRKENEQLKGQLEIQKKEIARLRERDKSAEDRIDEAGARTKVEKSGRREIEAEKDRLQKLIEQIAGLVESGNAFGKRGGALEGIAELIKSEKAS